MDLAGFAEPWEQARLLSDRARNRALLELLRRRAPGAAVLEVGCGTGLLSCVAARLGARKVWAVEPTPLADLAIELARVNGLDGTVEVLPGTVQELEPRPVDLAFSELLNADPLVEGVLGAMDAAAAWLLPGGCLAPSRIRVRAALARSPDSARELRAALAAVEEMGRLHGLRLEPVSRFLAGAGSYPYLSSTQAPAGPPVTVLDLPLGRGARPASRRVVELRAAEAGPVAGVVAWFEAVLDDGLAISNAPGGADHWGRLVCAWPAELALRSGDRVAVRVLLDEGQGLSFELA